MIFVINLSLRLFCELRQSFWKTTEDIVQSFWNENHCKHPFFLKKFCQLNVRYGIATTTRFSCFYKSKFRKPNLLFVGSPEREESSNSFLFSRDRLTIVRTVSLLLLTKLVERRINGIPKVNRDQDRWR
jgi:hypothetical protein